MCIYLFYSMDNNNDLTSNLEGFPLFPEIFLLDTPDLHPSSNEISFLGSQLEKLTLDTHTQSLRIEIEHVK